MGNARDRELGMDRNITRRDFLNGMVLLVGGAMVSPGILQALEVEADPEKARDYYPPALTGMRGSHAGSYETAHDVKDGSFWKSAGPAKDTGEKYDLAIVGAGISGLAAAHYYRKIAGRKARILLLDNHNDFGGHATRNEFRSAGRTLLGFGGTFSIESPAPYSHVAKELIAELGIEMSRWPRVFDSKLYDSLGLGAAFFFDKETFGTDRLVRFAKGTGGRYSAEQVLAQAASPKFLLEAPLTAAAKLDLTRLLLEKKDYLPGLTSAEKKARLARVSYLDFLTKFAKVDTLIAKLFNSLPQGLYGVGIDAVSAQDAWGLGFPGFEGMGLDPAPGPGMGRDAIPNEEADKFFFHFPDGNATIARLLVRGLIPRVLPGNSLDDVVTARADYARLDEASWPVRIRLNSTAVRVRHVGSPESAKETEITYVREGKLRTVRASHCILACWHVMIPYLCAELPEKQKTALADMVKVPIVYTNVALTNWRAFQKLGVQAIHAPGGYHTTVHLDLPVSLGAYQCAKSPEQPIVVHMVRTPCHPGLPARDQHRQGRIELLITSFETFEREIREQLGRMLGGGGFDPARDIAGITVNRWPHGYSYQYNSLWDPYWLEGGELPCDVARRTFGRIAIANSDAGAYAYTDGAIDEAHRAVQEITSRRS